MDFIKKLEEHYDQQTIEQEKGLAMAFFTAIQYIYKKSLGDKTIPAWERWINNPAQTNFVWPHVDENRIKTFLKDFNDNFLIYKDLDCFTALNGFKTITEAGCAANYEKDPSERRVFDIEECLNLMAKKDGHLKPFDELKSISRDSETGQELKRSILEFKGIVESHGNGISR